jgi:hypothetical protein
MLDVGDRLRLVGLGLDRLVAPDMVRNGTAERPGTEVGTGVGLFAVGPEQSQSVAGREVGRVLECGQVPPHPGGHDEQRSEHAQAQEDELPTERGRAGGQGGRNQEEGDEEYELGPDEGLGTAGHAEKDGAHPGGPSPQPDDGQEDESHEQHVRRLRHQDAVGEPHVGVAGGQKCGGESDPGSGQSPAQKTDAEDDPGPQDGHRHPLGRGPGVEAEQPGRRSQEERGERGMGGALGCDEGSPEELTDGETEAGEAVPEGVVQLAVLVARHDEDVGHPHAGAGEDDGGEGQAEAQAPHRTADRPEDGGPAAVARRRRPLGRVGSVAGGDLVSGDLVSGDLVSVDLVSVDHRVPNWSAMQRLTVWGRGWPVGMGRESGA